MLAAMGGLAPDGRRFAASFFGAALVAALAGCAETIPPEAEAPQGAAAPTLEEMEIAAPPPPVDPPTALADPEPPETVGGPVRAALLLPLSGPRAAIGQALSNAAQLALFDRAATPMALLPRDTGGTPEGAEAALRDALAEGVDIVLGPLFAESVRAVAPIARAAGAPVVAFTNDRRVAGGGVYTLGLDPGQQVARAVDHARSLGHARFGALAPDDAYGDAAVEALVGAAGSNFASVGEIARFPPRAAASAVASIESLAAARASESAGFDALLVAASGNALAALAPLLPYYNLDPEAVRYLGTALWKDPEILGEPSLVNALFAAPEDRAFLAFAARYRRAFGADPPRIAALGYDAAALVAALAGRSDRAPRFPARALTSPDGFSGAEGLFRFRPDGAAERGLAIWRVARTGFEIVAPAPENFAIPAF